VWTATLPESDQTEGRLLDLYGTVLWQEPGGEPVIGVHEGPSGLHEVAADGTVQPMSDAFPGGIVGQTDDGSVVLVHDEDGPDGHAVDVVGRTVDGAATFALGATSGGGGLGHGGQRAPGDVTAVTSGPG